MGYKAEKGKKNIAKRENIRNFASRFVRTGFPEPAVSRVNSAAY